MGRYDLGFEHIREPDKMLETGDVVGSHTHNAHHNTDFISGLWKVERWEPDGDGWLELPAYVIRGGGPRSIIAIPKDMKHRFTVLEGPAFYRCRFAWRDADGKVSEINHHYDHWNV